MRQTPPPPGPAPAGRCVLVRRSRPRGPGETAPAPGSADPASPRHPWSLPPGTASAPPPPPEPFLRRRVPCFSIYLPGQPGWWRYWQGGTGRLPRQQLPVRDQRLVGARQWLRRPQPSPSPEFLPSETQNRLFSVLLLQDGGAASHHSRGSGAQPVIKRTVNGEGTGKAGTWRGCQPRRRLSPWIIPRKVATSAMGALLHTGTEEN